MELLTPELKARFKELGLQEEEDDPIVVAKFFAPSGAATWFAIAHYDHNNTCFGYVQGLSPNPWDDEFGYFSITELEAVRVPPFGLPIERDLHWKEGPFSKVVEKRAR